MGVVKDHGMRKIQIRTKKSSHIIGGTEVSYTCPEYTLQYPIGLTAAEYDERPGRSGDPMECNYRTIKNSLPEGSRITTAAEELEIQLELEESFRNHLSESDAFKDPLSKSGAFKDLFIDYDPCGECGHTLHQLTETGLRVPKRSTPGYNPTNPDYIDNHGKKYWIREVLHGNEVVGEVFVPEGKFRSVAEWDEVFGIPTIITNKRGSPFRTRFFFDPDPPIDEETGRQDIRISRNISATAYPSFGVYATHRESIGLFRMVKDTIPKIAKE